MLGNAKAYELLVESTKATFNATGRNWDQLSDVEKGERLQAQRQGLGVILGYYEEQGFGLRTAYMRAMVEATEAPDAEETISGVRNMLTSIANGYGPGVSAEQAQTLLKGLDAVELAEDDDAY